MFTLDFVRYDLTSDEKKQDIVFLKDIVTIIVDNVHHQTPYSVDIHKTIKSCTINRVRGKKFDNGLHKCVDLKVFVDSKIYLVIEPKKSGVIFDDFKRAIFYSSSTKKINQTVDGQYFRTEYDFDPFRLIHGTYVTNI